MFWQVVVSRVSAIDVMKSMLPFRLVTLTRGKVLLLMFLLVLISILVIGWEKLRHLSMERAGQDYNGTRRRTRLVFIFRRFIF